MRFKREPDCETRLLKARRAVCSLVCLLSVFCSGPSAARESVSLDNRLRQSVDESVERFREEKGLPDLRQGAWATIIEVPSFTTLAPLQDEIKVPVKFVGNGSKTLEEKFRDKDFRKKIEDCVNEIWSQVKIKFEFKDDIETLDGKSKKAQFEHHDKEKNVIHIYLTTGDTAETIFKDNEDPKPGEGIATIGDGRFNKLTGKSPDPKSKDERSLTDVEALCETVAH